MALVKNVQKKKIINEKADQLNGQLIFMTFFDCRIHQTLCLLMLDRV
jgi:hypothetical protein